MGSGCWSKRINGTDAGLLSCGAPREGISVRSDDATLAPPAKDAPLEDRLAYWCDGPDLRGRHTTFGNLIHVYGSDNAVCDAILDETMPEPYLSLARKGLRIEILYQRALIRHEQAMLLYVKAVARR